MRMHVAKGMAGLALAVILVAVAPAAERALLHDMYVCANLSGQGHFMGGRRPVLSGLQVSSDRENFQHVGPTHIRFFSVFADPRRTDTIFGTALDGVLRSRDGGRTWRIMTDWRMTEPHVAVFDPNAPDHIYAGLPDGIGVSHDRGQTWVRMNEGIRRSFTHGLAVDRSKAGRVLAGTELGIYLTEDGARTWRLVLPTAKVTYDIQQSPGDARVFLAVTSSDGAFRTDDGGLTWQALAGVPKNRTLHNCDFDASDPRRLIIGGWGAGVLVSEDGGQSWADRSAGLPSRDVNQVSADPDRPGRIYAAPHLAPLYVSDDLGRTWRPLAFEKAIIYYIAFLPRP